MKIVQVIPEFSMGGAETMCENLTLALLRQGHDVTAVSLYHTETPITERLIFHNVRVLFFEKKLGFDVRLIFQLAEFFKKEKPDVVHTHLYTMKYVIPATVLAGVKTRVHTVHNVAEKEATPQNQKLNSFFYHFFHVTAVALSEEVKKSIENVYRIPGQKIPIVFNGIDLSKCVVKQNYEISNNSPRILHIGRFSEQKNHVGLLTAFQKVLEAYPDAILELVGDGELRPEMEQLVVRLGIENNVHFLGLQSVVSQFLHDADIFILPSNYEGVPMTLIEAMGTGLPIIATCVGGVPDMLADGVSALLIRNDTDEIAESMKTLIGNEKMRRQLGYEARNRSVVFSSEIMAQKYIEIYAKR